MTTTMPTAMKKELMIYTNLVALTCILVSFEIIVKHRNSDAILTTYPVRSISSIAFDVPANVYFIKGVENKIILEGPGMQLGNLVLDDHFGHFELKNDMSLGVLTSIETFLNENKPINMYVVSDDISNISVRNTQGCVVQNAIFNGDRGLVKVNDSEIIKFSQVSELTEWSYNTNSSCSEQKSSLTNCL